MTPRKKPEWFQMAENDGPKPVRTIKRGARSIALIAPLLLLGVGVLVAQSNDGGPASAIETPVTQSLVTHAPASTPTPSSSTSKTSTPIIQKPLSGGHNDDGEGFEGDDD